MTYNNDIEFDHTAKTVKLMPSQSGHKATTTELIQALASEWENTNEN